MFSIAVLFLVGAAVAFGVAFSGGGTSLLYVSILFSIGALALVARAVLRERSTTPVGEGSSTGAEVSVAEPAVGEASAEEPEVVALPERGTYHRADCRHVRERSRVERIPLATARGRGYTACGVCKPG